MVCKSCTDIPERYEIINNQTIAEFHGTSQNLTNSEIFKKRQKQTKTVFYKCLYVT
jgi:hypothetical protein